LTVTAPGVDDHALDQPVQRLAVVEVQAFQEVEPDALDLGFDQRVVVVARQIGIDQGLDSVRALSRS
jgi:hypothetical protein